MKIIKGDLVLKENTIIDDDLKIKGKDADKKIIEEVLKEVIEEEKQSLLIGSGDDMYYITQLNNWLKANNKLINKILNKAIQKALQSQKQKIIKEIEKRIVKLKSCAEFEKDREALNQFYARINELKELLKSLEDENV